MPYPNTNGRWFNGKLDVEIATKMFERTNIRKVSESPAAIQSEVELDRQHESKKEQELDFNATSNISTPYFRILLPRRKSWNLYSASKKYER